MFSKLGREYVAHVYADHNSTKRVRTKIAGLLDSQAPDAFILNVGAGAERIADNVLNLDIFDGPNVDYVSSAEQMPIADLCVDLIITQEAFEHIRRLQNALDECYRILKPDGIMYFQVPFIIGYHPGPTDFLRFTREGVVEVLEATGFEILEIDITVGGATGFYRIAVEFFACLFSGPVTPLYKPAKACAALILYPIKFLDRWFNLSKERDRIAGGYYAVVRKK